MWMIGRKLLYEKARLLTMAPMVLVHKRHHQRQLAQPMDDLTSQQLQRHMEQITPTVGSLFSVPILL